MIWISAIVKQFVVSVYATLKKIHVRICQQLFELPSKFVAFPQSCSGKIPLEIPISAS